uniref:Uncharacterized protein n=1 Tax=Anopheles melas TaxID=34690 RepID=A0A182U5J0_9DIPT
MQNESFNSAEKDTKVLRAIAPNDLKGFSLYRQKMTDMVNYAIGPFFRDLFLKDVRGEYHSLLFEETEGNNILKEMEVTVNYFSSHLTKLMFFHLNSAFLALAECRLQLSLIEELQRRTNCVRAKGELQSATVMSLNPCLKQRQNMILPDRKLQQATLGSLNMRLQRAPLTTLMWGCSNGGMRSRLTGGCNGRL